MLSRPLTEDDELKRRMPDTSGRWMLRNELRIDRLGLSRSLSCLIDRTSRSSVTTSGSMSRGTLPNMGITFRASTKSSMGDDECGVLMTMGAWASGIGLGLTDSALGK